MIIRILKHKFVLIRKFVVKKINLWMNTNYKKLSKKMSLWEKTTIRTDVGDLQEAICPKVISASRSTDIPAYFGEWFMTRIKQGYFAWTNPFNNKTLYVSTSRVRLIVFWSKNPKAFTPYLIELDKLNLNYYFQFTLNDYENEAFEPNLDSLTERIETFKKLSAQIGKQKVIWRFDPLILSPTLNVEKLIGKIDALACEIHNFTEKLVVSFVQISDYKKVANNIRSKRLDCREFKMEESYSFAEEISKVAQKWNLKVATCSEKYDLQTYGIQPNKCIDDTLIREVFQHDAELMAFINNSKTLKDKGQRQFCKCIPSKDIGMYNTCNHLCVYCYANSSDNLVKMNFNKHNSNSEKIV